MARQGKLEPAGEQPSLRLDIHLNLDAASSSENPLAWLSQYAHSQQSGASGDALIDLASKIYQSRRLRSRYINPTLLGEPVWDMLLALYCFGGRGEVLSVSGLCVAADVPQSTALRGVQVMEQKKLIRRTKDRTDGRRALVSLTDEAKQMMEDYLFAIHPSRP